MSNTLQATKVMSILGLGTDAEDETGFVEIVTQDGSQVAIAFDIDMADYLSIAFLQAAAHLRYKWQLRLAHGETLIPGQPVTISAGNAEPVIAGGEAMILLTLMTPQNLELRFVMTPRAAAVLAKRLTKKMVSGPRRPT